MPQGRSSFRNGVFRISWPLIVAACSTLGILAFSSFQSLGDPDTFLHIKIGQWILSHHTVPVVDYFSHSLPGEAWVAHEWLSELLIALIYHIGGWGGLVLMASGCLAFTLAYLTRFLLKRIPPVYAILFAALAFFALSTHLLVRPHVLVWPLLVIWVGTLIGAQEQGRHPPFFLIFIMVLWVNLHGSFIFGIAITLPIALEVMVMCPQEKRRKLMLQWLSFIAISLAACLFNPQGLAGVIFPLQIFNLKHLATIKEWMPYRFSGLNPLEIILFIYLILALLGLLRLPLIRILVLLGLLHMAFTHNRYVSILGLVSPMLIASTFGNAYLARNQQHPPSKIDRFFLQLSLPAGAFAIIATLGLVIISAFISIQFGRYRPPESIQANAAIDAVQRSSIHGSVLNDYQFGGALIYRGIPVFVDGRADLYDQQVMGLYIDAMIDGKPSALAQIIQKYKIGWALLALDSPAIAYFENQAGWQRFYSDTFAVVYIRAPQAQ